MGKWKQFLAAALAVTVVSVSAPASHASEAVNSRENGSLQQLADVQDGLLAYYDFAEKPSDGKTVENKAGGEIGAAVVQNDAKAEWKDGALVLSGEGKSNSPVGPWVSLPSNLFTGKESATIVMEVCPTADIITKNHFMWSIGNSGTDLYWFANTMDPRTSIKIAGGERTAQAPSKLTADRWYSFTGVINAEKQTITLYIDGVKVADRKSDGISLKKVTDQSRNTIGRAPYGDDLFSGSVASFRAYGRALEGSEIRQLAAEDGKRHEASFADAAKQEVQEVADSVKDLEISDSVTLLPDYKGRVSWKSNMSQVTIREDGVTADCKQPAHGSQAVSGEMTAVVSIRGITMEKKVKAAIQPAVADDDPYGYLLVHFIEDKYGYQEKIYLDISRGDSPQQWDPLNGREPILASNLGYTGVRDPFITYSPESGKYYILGTDLRVFGGDFPDRSGNHWSGYGSWSNNHSTKLVIWESEDLIHWGEPHLVDTALDKEGNKKENMGMAWAPETTWVPDYYGEGDGAFVVYWSSQCYHDEEQRDYDGGSHIMWGVTKDFTQNTWEFGGRLLNYDGVIDMTVGQSGGKTYHVTKGGNIFMEVTEAKRWWEPGTQWTRIQERIGESWFGGVEGPAIFKDHSDPDRWYLFVDDMPEPGYQPMVTMDLEKGWDYIDSPDYFLTENTKHGGVISLTKKQYDAIRNADAVSIAEAPAQEAEVTAGASKEEVLAKLPATVKVNTAYGRGTADLLVDWDISEVKTDAEGEYTATGTVQSIGANLNEWVGKGGSLEWDAADKTLYSMTALTVSVPVKVSEKKEPPKPPSVKVKKVSLNKTKLTLGAGESFTLKATVTPKNATDKKVTFTSSKKSVAEVKNGVVKAKKPGTAAITAKAGGKTAKCVVTVKKAPKKISLNAKKKTLKKGKAFQLKVNLPKGTASNKITYTSSKRKVASVSSTGKIKALKKGKATITVKTFNKKSAKIVVTVKAK